MEEFNWIFMMEKMQDIKLFTRTIVNRVSKESSLSPQHLEVLSQLVTHNVSMTPKSLSNIMGVSKTILSRIIDKLNQDEYVIKVYDQYDKRSYSILITDRGRKEIAQIYKIYLEPIYKLRRNLGEEDFLNLIHYIEQANRKMNCKGEE